MAGYAYIYFQEGASGRFETVLTNSETNGMRRTGYSEAFREDQDALLGASRRAQAHFEKSSKVI